MSAAEQTGANIREARKAVGLSQEELAFQADVHPKAISGYETGRVRPTAATMARLAAVLGVASGDLAVSVEPPIPDWEPVTVAEEFGRNLFMARRRAGLSQRALADRAGMSLDGVNKIERGRRSVRLLSLLNLAAATGVDPCDLLKGLRP